MVYSPDVRLHLGAAEDSCSPTEWTFPFIPSCASRPVSKSIICLSVLQASGRFSQPQTVVKNCCQAFSSGRRRAFVLEVCAAPSLKINCVLIAEPDERLGEMFRCDKWDSPVGGGPTCGPSCCVSFMPLIITQRRVFLLLRHQRCQIISSDTFTVCH